MSEVWRDIPGYVGLYQVSDQGRVKSLARIVHRPPKGPYPLKERFIALITDTCGYLRVGLHKDSRKTTKKVHRIVLMTFAPHVNQGDLHVNHKDGNKKNNCLENLEWCTVSENELHKYRVLKQPNPNKGKFGKDAANGKPVTAIHPDGTRKTYWTASCAKVDGFSFGGISDVVNGRRKTHGGWRWEFATPENGNQKSGADHRHPSRGAGC
jgi:hypothetical protein